MKDPAIRLGASKVRIGQSIAPFAPCCWALAMAVGMMVATDVAIAILAMSTPSDAEHRQGRNQRWHQQYPATNAEEAGEETGETANTHEKRPACCERGRRHGLLAPYCAKIDPSDAAGTASFISRLKAICAAASSLSKVSASSTLTNPS